MVTPDSFFLPRTELDRLFSALAADGRRVVGPMIADGAVVYDELDSDTVVEGFYLLSLVDPLVSGLFRRAEGHDEVLNYGVEQVRFPSTVREDDVLRLHCSVPAVMVRPSGGRVVRYDCTLEVDCRDAPGMVATWLLHVPAPSR